MPLLFRRKTDQAASRFSCAALLLSATVLISINPLAHAQSTFGTISGTVTDPAGAVIPNASVTLTQNDTGASRTILSDGRGDFQAVNVNAGTYTIVVKVPGFVERKFENVAVLARQSVVIDAKLQVGETNAQSIQVTAGAELIDQDLTTGSTTSGDEINQLALNFRATSNTSPLVVALVSPTVQTDPSGNISVAGSLPNMTSFSLDGISTQSVRNGGPNADLFPSVETIAEFKVNTGSNDAEFGQVSDITVTSKSGTNDFHGSVFLFDQNAAFNAADPFAHKVLPIIANDFGVTLGGPVSIPHFYNGKDKTFFFFTYEGTRRPQTSLVNEIVPSTAFRSGDLSGDSTPIINPFTGSAIPNNNLAAAGLVNPASLKVIAALFPEPNVVNGPTDAVNLYTIKGKYHLDSYDGRIDQVINSRQKVFVRYSHKDVDNVGVDGDSSYNPLLGPFSNGQKLRNLAGSYNWIIKSNLVNEARAGFSLVNTINEYPLASQGGALNASFGIQNLPPVPSSGGVPDFILYNNYVGGNTNPVGRPRHVQQHTYEAGDNLTWILGSHSTKFGFDFSRLSYIDQITFTNGDEFGDYYYTGAVTGNAYADFLIGLPVFTDYAQNGPDGQPFAYHYGFFGQDDWKVNHKLTISYGLRYEINPPFDDATSQLGQFDRNYPGGRLITQGAKGLSLVAPSWRAQVGDTPFLTNEAAGIPHTLRYTYYGNVQPRLGFAYDTMGDGKTVLKAHVGTYSVPVLGAVLYSLLGVDTSNFPNFTSSATNPLIFPNVFGAGGTYPVNCNSASTLPAGATAGSPACPGYRRANDEHLKDPRVLQWNASIEQALSSNTLLRLTYNGSHTTQLIHSPDLNQLQPNTQGYAALTATPALRQANLKYPNFEEVLSRDNGPSAKYNAGIVEVTRRFASGLTYDGSYTWAKNLTNALGSAPNSLIGNGGQGDNGANTLNYYDIHSDYGNAVYTRRNRFVNTFLYQLPLGRGKQFLSGTGRITDLALGGWDLTGVTILQTGPFLTATYNGSTDPSGTAPQYRSEGSFQRPDCNAANDQLNRHTNGLYYNQAGFSVPANNIGRFGTCPVGNLNGPGTTVFSATIGKDFHISERYSLRYEAAFSNLLNIENLSAPDTNISDASFGTISSVQGSTGGPNPDQAGPRTIQMSVRLKF
jgi:hypothetical protein